MFIAYFASGMGLSDIMMYLNFCLWPGGFGFLGMGPVTTAVDNYGPVTDNAQSIYELSLIEAIPDIENKIEKNMVKPDFDKAKYYLSLTTVQETL